MPNSGAPHASGAESHGPERVLRDAASEHRLIVATFDTQPAAKGALGAMAVAHAEGRLAWLHVAELRRDTAGVLTIRETAGMSTARAALAGGLVGGFVGMLARKPGRVAALGTIVGVGINAVIDVGIPDPKLHAIGAQLPNDASCLVIVAESGMVERVSALVEQRGGEAVVEPWQMGARFVAPRFKASSLQELSRKTQGTLQSGTGELQQVLATAATQARRLALRLQEVSRRQSIATQSTTQRAAEASDAATLRWTQTQFAAGAGAVDGGRVGDGLSSRDLTALSPEQMGRGAEMGTEGREIAGSGSADEGSADTVGNAGRTSETAAEDSGRAGGAGTGRFGSEGNEGGTRDAGNGADGAQRSDDVVGWVNTSADVQDANAAAHEVLGALHIGSTGGYEDVPTKPGEGGAGSGSVGYGVENEAEWGTPEIRRQSQVAQEQGGRWAEDPVWEPGSPSEESTMVMHSVENVFGEAVINPTPVTNAFEEGIMADHHTDTSSDSQQGQQAEQSNQQGGQQGGQGQSQGRSQQNQQGQGGKSDANDASQMSTKNNDERSIFGDASASTGTTASAAATDPYNDQKPGENVDRALKND